MSSCPLSPQNAAAVRYLNFKGEAAVNSTEYDYTGFTDVQLYRRFRFLSKQGPGALDEAELTEVSVFSLSCGLYLYVGSGSVEPGRADHWDLNILANTDESIAT